MPQCSYVDSGNDGSLCTHDLRRFTALLLSVFLMVSSAASQDYRAADNFCSSALEQTTKPRTIALLQKCREAIDQLRAAVGTSIVPGISARGSIVEALQRAAEAEEEKDRVSLLRLFPRLLRLVGELQSQSVDNRSHSLGRLQHGIWLKFEKLWERNEQSRTVWTGQDNEKLAYQYYAAQGKELKIIELLSDSKTKQAEWREGRPSLLTQDFIQSLAKATNRSKSGSTDNRFILLFPPQDLSLERERTLSEKLKELPHVGIVPLVEVTPDRARPFVHLPAVEGIPRGRDADRSKIRMILLPRGVHVASWSWDKHDRYVPSVVEEAIAIATDVVQSLQIQTAKALLSDFVATPKQSRGKKKYVVTQQTRAAFADTDKDLELAGGEELQELLVLGDWIKGIVEDKDQPVWLRKSLLKEVIDEPKAPPPAGPNKSQHKKSDSTEPLPKENN